MLGKFVVPIVTTLTRAIPGSCHADMFSCRANRYILRKKPQGQSISPVAHQIDREYRVLKALGSVDGFPVPKVYGFHLDSSIIGTPFYVSLIGAACVQTSSAAAALRCTCELTLCQRRLWSSSRAESSLM